MTDQSYADLFVDALRFNLKLHPHECLENVDLTAIRKNIDENRKMSAEHDKIIEYLQVIGPDFLASRLRSGAGNNRACHAVSDDFFRHWQMMPFAQMFQLSVTIGNVFYKGQNVYETSKTKIKRILNAGPQPDETLDVHVWLTLSDMTVLDLSILSTAEAKGCDISQYSDSHVLIWRDGQPSDFDYEPLLVDDHFYEKVERV